MGDISSYIVGGITGFALGFFGIYYNRPLFYVILFLVCSLYAIVRKVI